MLLLLLLMSFLYRIMGPLLKIKPKFWTHYCLRNGMKIGKYETNIETHKLCVYLCFVHFRWFSLHRFMRLLQIRNYNIAIIININYGQKCENDLLPTTFRDTRTQSHTHTLTYVCSLQFLRSQWTNNMFRTHRIGELSLNNIFSSIKWTKFCGSDTHREGEREIKLEP